MSRKQLRIFKLDPLKTRSGGGRGHLRTTRFFVPKRPVHLVMRSEHARGRLNLKRSEEEIFEISDRCARRFHVRVRGIVNVGNHLHLHVVARRREDFSNFLRTFAALVAREVTGAQRGKPFVAMEGGPSGRGATAGAGGGASPKRADRFWTSLAFTRVLGSRREEMILNRYLEANLYESAHGKDVRDWFFANYPFGLPRRGAG